jgi:hypothetical protein
MRFRLKAILVAVPALLSTIALWSGHATGQATTPAPVSAPAAPASGTPAPQTLEKILISGEQPGPGMWKVTKGDNVLWIVGEQSPMPKNMKWRAKQLETVVASAQEIISGPGATVSPKQIGYFTALTVLPSAMEARKNPNGATLRTVVPPEEYRRWEVLRQKYVGQYNNDEEADIERWRPMFAAFELYSRAIDKSGMSSSSVVWPVIRSNAEKHKVKITSAAYEPKIDNLRGAVRELKGSSLADLDCFTKTMDRIDTDLELMRRRANAWARGNIDAIRALPVADQRVACETAIMNASFVKALGVQDISARIQEAWLAKVDEALSKNKVTVSTLSIRMLTPPNTYLTKLKERGYTVEEPE